MSVVVFPDCYEYIVGLSRTNCECYDIPGDAETSLSGLYIDELTGLAFLKAITDCENNADVFNLIDRARQVAVTNFQADTNALLMKSHKLRRQNYKGAIGRAISKNNPSLTTGQYYGIRIYCANVKSGVLRLTSIGALFSLTDSITVYIYNNLGDLIDTVTVNTEANKHKQTPVDIELPMHSDYVENLQYFLFYQLGANTPKGNDLKCNCGGFKAVFNTDNPYTNHLHGDRNYLWSQWIMAGGYHSTGFPDLDACTTTTNNLMYGLTLDVELKCKVNEVLCMDGLDFETNNLAGAMAIAIQHKAGSVLAGWILSSGNLNRYTLINTEQLVADMEAWGKVYNDMVTYIAAEADTSVNDCLICKDIVEMTRKGILA